MKIAVLSDIHGNYIALKAVLEDAFKQKVDCFIIAGDHIGDGPNPKKVVDTIRELNNCWAIKGNKEEKIIAYHKGKHPDWTNCYQTAVFVWTSKKLNNEDIAYLDSMPIHKTIIINGLPRIKVVHGSPDKADEKIDMDNNTDRVCEILDAIDEQILIYGHSHIPRVLLHNSKMALNPGSVGLPFNEKAMAEYTILEWKDNNWIYKQQLIEYDKDILKKEFDDSGLIVECGAWAKGSLQSMIQGKDIAISFLRRAYQLSKERGYSSYLVPNEIWLEVDQCWDWEY